MMSQPWFKILLLITASVLISIIYGNSPEGQPSIVSILPPIIAIASAFILRQVIVSLFAGIWFGAWALNGQGFDGIYIGLIEIPKKYTVDVLLDGDNIMIVLLTLFISGMVGVISSNGGMIGLVKHITTWAKSRKRVQQSTAILGLVIFFDDYANTLIIGNTMRPVTDDSKISREKLAYIVDSTAAPVATVALISSWIGFQVGLIESSIETISGLDKPYLIFLESLAYSFYPFLSIIFVLFITSTGRDYGPMLAAEKRAIAGNVAGNAPDFIETDQKISSGAINAVLPILVLIFSVIAGIFLTGTGDTFREILGSANSFVALLMAGFFGSLVAIGLSVSQSILTLEEAIEAWAGGLRMVVTALVILILSWVLASITKELHTADFIVSMISDDLSPALLPAIVFIISGIISMGTGTSWGTMGILMPLVIPLSWALISSADGTVAASDMHIVYSSVSAVLAGAVWGDHCSPISDTTILSSMASQCNHVDHVRTQMPYALTVGGVALVLGTIPAGLGLPWWIGLGLGIIVLWFVLKRFGETVQ
jgi:Na+/H+ antiporter NhaC